MKPSEKFLPIYCRLVGTMEVATGLLLMLAPVMTLELLGLRAAVESWAGEPVLLRFIGAFVAGVGACYFLPFLAEAQERWVRFEVILEATALVRACVGLWVAVAVARRWLEVGWLTVAVTDLGLAAWQFHFRRRLRRAHGISGGPEGQ